MVLSGPAIGNACCPQKEIVTNRLAIGAANGRLYLAP